MRPRLLVAAPGVPVARVVRVLVVAWQVLLLFGGAKDLAGAVDLFPPRERRDRFARAPIPKGEANLEFEYG